MNENSEFKLFIWNKNEGWIFFFFISLETIDVTFNFTDVIDNSLKREKNSKWKIFSQKIGITSLKKRAHNFTFSYE